MKWDCQKVPICSLQGTAVFFWKRRSLVSIRIKIALRGIFLAKGKFNGLPGSIFRKVRGGEGGEKNNDR